MAKVSDGTTVSLPAIKSELDTLSTQRAVLLEQVAQIDARSALLRQVLDFGLAEAAGTTTQNVTPARSGIGSVAPSGPGAGQPTTRKFILKVMATMPPGTKFTTDDLRTRLANEHDHRPRLETLRRSAERMADRGELVRVDSKTWATLPTPKAGGATS